MSQACVVTGASTGIGRAVVEKLASSGFRVFAGVRRPQDVASLVQAFGEAVTPVQFDVTDAEAVTAAARQVAAALGPEGRLAGLVNNAGIAIAAPLLHMPLAELRQVLDVNVVAQVGVTQAFAPLLGAERARKGSAGRVVNIVSTMGRLTTPFVTAYAASKHAMEAVTDGFRRELLIYGIDVVAIEPGVVWTPMYEKAERADYSRYDSTDFKPSFQALRDLMIAEARKGVKPSQIADAVHRALTARRPPARIAVVAGRLKNWTVPRLLPDRALDKFVAALIGLKPV